jgi:sporulation integral membrane protein YlbJ
MRSRYLTPSFLIVFLILSIVVLLILFPFQSLSAALRGVSIWWDVLFPALFPFFVISEMLLGFGIVHFLGTLLDPLMRPVFRIPGIGGFVMAMGFASGYPVGAKLTAQLWEQKWITREEGERLVAFTTSSDPIFLIGAVSVGFFYDQSLAFILAISHYGGAIIIGLLMRFHGVTSTPTLQPPPSKGFIVKRALQAMHEARMKDGRPIGILLSQAIQQSLGLIFVVGGLVVFFSVILEVLTTGGIMGFLYTCIRSLLQVIGMPASLSEAIIKGLFEVTLGTKAAAGAGNVPLESKTAIAAFVLSWAGLSVHAQVVSLLSHTNLRYLPFLLARLTHGLIASTLVLALWKPLQSLRSEMPVFLHEYDVSTPFSSFLHLIVPVSGFVITGTFVCILFLFMIYSLGKLLFGKSKTRPEL